MNSINSAHPEVKQYPPIAAAPGLCLVSSSPKLYNIYTTGNMLSKQKRGVFTDIENRGCGEQGT